MALALSKDILQHCQEHGKIPLAELERLVAHANEDAAIFASLAVKEGWLDRNSVGRYLADQFHYSFVDMQKTIFQRPLLEKLPADIAEKLRVIPIYQLGDAVTVAMADPVDSYSISKLEGFFNSPVSPVFALPDDIVTAIKLHYPDVDDLKNISQQTEMELITLSQEMSQIEMEKLVGSERIITVVDSLLMMALAERASDIHIQQGKKDLSIRYRIDGILYPKCRAPKQLGAAIISRIKIMADLDIGVRKKPQDGRLSIHLPATTVDARVSVMPVIGGEKVVIRILGSEFSYDELNFSNLGFAPRITKLVQYASTEPNGLLFVTGPTGSGKTTSLHCILNSINTPENNIVTLEDPIEYHSDDLTQANLNDKAGIDFSALLRSALRQDPDIVFIGEIRDPETAKIAANAALTGHLVVTSLHTNTALQAISRMIEMGVDRFIVGSTVTGVLAQRLVRRLCDNCKHKRKINEEDLKQHFYWQDKNSPSQVTLFEPRGCSKCRHLGFRGRIPIHEFILANSDIRQAIISNANYSELTELVEKQPRYRSMRHDGYLKALQGLTTLKEVERVVSNL